MDFNTFKRSCGAQGESYITIIKDWQRKAKWQWNLEFLLQDISRLSNIQNGAKKSAPNCIDISGPISQISLSTPAHLLAIPDAHHCTFNQWSDTSDTFPCSNSWSPHLPKGITKDLGTLLRMIALAELLRLFLISMVFRLVGSMNLPQSYLMGLHCCLPISISCNHLGMNQVLGDSVPQKFYTVFSSYIQMLDMIYRKDMHNISFQRNSLVCSSFWHPPNLLRVAGDIVTFKLTKFWYDPFVEHVHLTTNGGHRGIASEIERIWVMDSVEW